MSTVKNEDEKINQNMKVWKKQSYKIYDAFIMSTGF